MRITRKMIEATAKFFPTRYTFQQYDHGFEVISHKRGEVCSVFFWNDGSAIRTDVRLDLATKMRIKDAAIVLGMTTLHRAA